MLQLWMLKYIMTLRRSCNCRSSFMKLLHYEKTAFSDFHIFQFPHFWIYPFLTCSAFGRIKCYVLYCAVIGRIIPPPHRRFPSFSFSLLFHVLVTVTQWAKLSTGKLQATAINEISRLFLLMPQFCNNMKINKCIFHRFMYITVYLCKCMIIWWWFS